ncbi:alpha/beta fold hydrolase [Flammeovirga kamogawensis]|uniref:Alpha/beta hydrolase n=1 Tax=Flammeovirga kamogawensis TaxID=373891 RepID=A0ABX8H4L4_9BACT|nr:alpha/beta hydrolase [Flammeovirga kamogawensis]MBB6463555.1 pimeloyl-ACP methyl ester carboxylesterase [Flammeovirga kamogawensis]QWG10609.1 alpha/beta hydrolase [Flammeovirga kamogawensis]TRX63714.1 alpha/beta hydrolase [Flammeovirga kamogawensis]
MKTVNKYGKKPFQIALLHGGPGASGGMKPMAQTLCADFSILELIQTEESVDGQIKELYNQISTCGDLPITLIGYSWGAWLGFIFTSMYPDLINKLILVSAGAFEVKYNQDLTSLRLGRLNKSDRKEAERLISKIDAGDTSNDTLKQFGKLMDIADSFDSVGMADDSSEINMKIFQSVWTEASKLRASEKLINLADNIKCPVVAIHGDYDSHPSEGVEIPLSERLNDFKMIKLKNCGHTPWKERLAKDAFYKILREEIVTSIN